MGPSEIAVIERSEVHRDAVAAGALTLIRRALFERRRVSCDALAQEVAVNLGASREDALREIDAVAQRLGVSALR